MDNNENKTPAKAKYTPWSLKQRLPLIILGALGLPFTVILYGVFDIYAGNRAEFDFSLTDVWMGIMLLFAICTAVLAVVLLAVKGKAFDIVFAVIFWLTVMAYLQGNFLNFGASGLSGDGGGAITENGFLVFIDVLVWGLALIGCILAVTARKNRDMVHAGAVILLAMVVGIQLFNFALTSLTTDVFKPKSEQTDILGEDETETGEGKDDDALEGLVLTEEDLYTVSKKNNIIIFMVDRFDANYAAEMTEIEPTFFDKLTGFTYYSDNISRYPRTYPAVASMITGIENDFSGSASEYFEKAYHDSEFLKLLKKNNYRINIYGDSYYTYRDAKELYGVADNVSVADGYKIVNKTKLIKNLIGLSSYRYVPIPAKSLYTLASTSFKGFVQYDAIYPEFITQDHEFYKGLLADGLSTRDDKSTYSFICMNGCHAPYNLTADGTYSEAGTSREEATRGTFKIIYDYLDKLKELGLYEDATIIITGDHANAVSDTKYLDGKRQTAIFFKPSGNSDEELAYSSAQVSQDNLIPSIVESAGLKTDTDFGKCYWEVPEGEDQVRKYLLIRSLRDDKGDRADVLVEYRITGDGSNFENWEIVNETLIGYLYK